VAENENITIDPAVLRRCAADLERVADGLGRAAVSINSTPMTARAFGLMNSWVVDPISAVSSQTSQLIDHADRVISTLGTATEEAAKDTEQSEETILEWVRTPDANLDATSKSGGW
jgi:hypothetical protein